MKCTPYHDFYGHHCLPNTGMNLAGWAIFFALMVAVGVFLCVAGWRNRHAHG